MKDLNYDELIGRDTATINKAELNEVKGFIQLHAQQQSEKERQNHQYWALTFRIQDYLASTDTQIVPVGYFIQHLLDIYRIAPQKFAQYIGYELNSFSTLLAGKTKVSYQLATQLYQIFDIQPEVWLYLEQKNEYKRFLKKNKLAKQYQLKDLQN